MNPNYVSSGMQAYYPAPYMPGQFQQAGCNMPYYPKTQNNAVNIEIIGPTAGSSPQGAMPIYPGMPQVMPQQMPICPPPIIPMPIPMPYPQQAYEQQLPQYIPQAPMSIPPQMQQFTPPAILPPPPMNLPPIPMPIPPGPVQQQLPPPPVIDQAPVTQQVQTPPAPNANAGKIEPLLSAIKMITPAQGDNVTLEDQSTALKTINEYINNSNNMDQNAQRDVSEKLLPSDGKTFKGLAAIASSDTNSLSGQEKQKADEVRVMSLLTLANLQKYFRREFEGQVKKENIQDVPAISMGELPGIKTVETVIRSDANPEVREAGIIALMGVADPNNKQDLAILKTILQTSATNDASDKVRTTAAEALGVVDGPKQQQ